MKFLLEDSNEFKLFVERCKLTQSGDYNESDFTLEKFKSTYSKYGLCADIVAVEPILGGVITDYFYVTQQLVPIRVLTIPFEEQAEYLAKCVEEVDKCFTSKEANLDSLIDYVEKRYYVDMFNRVYFKIADELGRKVIFRNAYRSIETGFSCINGKVFKDAFTLDEEEKKELLTLLNTLQPDEEYLTIYRGHGYKSTNVKKAHSWTLSKEVAEFFRDRGNYFTSKGSKFPRKLYKAKIKRGDILYYDEDSREFEVIVNYKDLIDVEEIDFQ